jgi:4-alpha-glucanotransferase
VANRKQRTLGSLSALAWRREAVAAELQAFMQERPEVASYARFRAQVEARGATWRSWPGREREGRQGSDLDERARYHIFVQYMLHRQLSAFAGTSRTALYLDLPVGVHGGGYDVWRYREQFSIGASVGAPPDQLFEGGQNWGFPPLHPQHSRADGHAYFAACLRNHLQYAKVLRIDHVMGLHRLFWIPDGADTRSGVYVRYPSEELIAVLSIEAHRAGARIVGENLGTVPAEVNEAMQRHRIMGMFVGQFAFTGKASAPLPRAGKGTLASLNTHDTPTFAGSLTGRDIDERERMGLLDKPAADKERAGRARLGKVLASYARRQGILKGKLHARALEALLRDLARSQAEIVLVNLEDLWLETEPQNIPGVTDGYPNWRRQSALNLEQITRSRSIAALLRELVALRTAAMDRRVRDGARPGAHRKPERQEAKR